MRRIGGARRDRTDDILLAKQALSQLSYGPIYSDPHSCPEGRPKEGPRQQFAACRRIRFRHSSGFRCVMAEPVRSVRQKNGGPG
jgi:hypothetical protein